MSRCRAFWSLAVALIVTVGLSGCGDKSKTESTEKKSPGEKTGKTQAAGGGVRHGGHFHASEAEAVMAHLSAEDRAAITEELAKLSEEDKAAVEAQEICPVQHAALGTMGAPIKVPVTASDGTEHDVFICCEGCREKLLEEPDKHLEFLAEQKK